MKQTLFLLLLPGLAAMTFATEIVCEKQGFNGHLQGIAADKTGIYWSFYDTVVKTDYTGKITASATVPPHAGDLCVSEGKIYVSLTYYHKADIQRDGGKGWVYIFDQNLQFRQKIALPDTPAPDGITRLGDRFYVAGNDFGKALHRVNTISLYSADWKYEGRVQVDIGVPTAYGAQTLNAVGDRILAAFYAKGKGSYFLTLPDMKPVEPFPCAVSVGMAVMPPELARGREIYLVAKSTGTHKDKQWGGRILIYERLNGKIVPADL